MLQMSRSFQICIVILCFSSFLLGMQDGISGCPVCSKGCGQENFFRPTSEETNDNLDNTVNILGEEIEIKCWNKRKNKSCSDFLSCVYYLLMRQEGNNPIHLYLSTNELAEDMSAFESFIEQCATNPIVNRLVSFDIGLNSFVELPENIAKLCALKRFFVSENQLNPTTIEQICTNMPFLESLDLEGCGLEGLPASFENLKLLHVLYVQWNLLTEKDLSLIQKLSNLEELHIGPAGVTCTDIIKTISRLPKIKKVWTEKSTEKGDISSLKSYFEAFPPLCPPDVETY